MPDPIDPMFRSLAISASGLSAQRARMQAIVENIANAETTRTAEGGPYRRKIAVLTAATAETKPASFAAALDAQLAVSDPAHFPRGLEARAPEAEGAGVSVERIAEDTTPGPLVYMPGHPDADARGYVRMPNVDVTNELVDLMEARRYFEANAQAFEAGKQILRKSIDI